MSTTNYEIPWSEGKIRTTDVTVTVEQGQLIHADGTLATKGTTTAATGLRAHYIAAASVTDSGRIGVYLNAVVTNSVIAAGSAGDPVYLGAGGAYTLTAPTAGDSDISQAIGFVRADKRAQITLENAPATTL